MLRLTADKTYRVLYSLLEQPIFNQIELSKNLGISLGQINKVIKWAMSKELVVKINGKYELIGPNKLVEMISSQYTINQNRVFFVNLNKKDLIAKLRKHLQLCLYSALEAYSSKSFQEIHSYYNDDLVKELNKLERGQTKIILYDKPFNVVFEHYHTSLVQTILDLASINENHLTKNLRFKKWGTLQ